MYFKIGNGLVVDSSRPFKMTELITHSFVGRRIRDEDEGPEYVEILMVKRRDVLEESLFWFEFKKEFPSAVIRTNEGSDHIYITDPFDCINFTFKLHQ